MIRCIHEDCKYRGLLSENIEYCNYIGHAKSARRCDPAVCDKYLSKQENTIATKTDCKGCMPDLIQRRYERCPAENDSAVLFQGSVAQPTKAKGMKPERKKDDCENVSGFTG